MRAVLHGYKLVSHTLPVLMAAGSGLVWSLGQGPTLDAWEREASEDIRFWFRAELMAESKSKFYLVLVGFRVWP